MNKTQLLRSTQRPCTVKICRQYPVSAACVEWANGEGCLTQNSASLYITISGYELDWSKFETDACADFTKLLTLRSVCVNQRMSGEKWAVNVRGGPTDKVITREVSWPETNSTGNAGSFWTYVHDSQFRSWDTKMVAFFGRTICCHSCQAISTQNKKPFGTSARWISTQLSRFSFLWTLSSNQTQLGHRTRRCLNCFLFRQEGRAKGVSNL